MNVCSFVGRIATDLELRESGDTKYLRFRLAVRRPRARDKENNTVFVPCVAFNKTAEFIAKHFKKGSFIFVVTSFQTDEYVADDGSKKTSYAFYVNEAGFCTPAPSNGSNSTGQQVGTPPLNSQPMGQPFGAAATPAMSQPAADFGVEIPF